MCEGSPRDQIEPIESPFDTYASGEHHMAIVHVYLWEVVSRDAKRKTIEGITRVLCELGVPAQAVEVLIHEVPKEDWGVAGECASERLKDARMP
jgi:4-oxalocrotonate tautomerase